MDQIEKLIERISSGHRIGQLANDIVRDIFDEKISENRLKKLIYHEDPDVVRSGAFILQELGPEGEPLLNEVKYLLEYPDPFVRFDTLSSAVAILADKSSLTEIEARVFYRGMKLLEDLDERVRWKAMNCLQKYPNRVIEAAISKISELVDDKEWKVYKRGLELLISIDPDKKGLIHNFANSNKPLLRKFGVIAAAKMYDEDKTIINNISTGDNDCNKFISRFLDKKKG